MSEAKQGYRVAVVGATGAVGQVMLELLAEREFPISELAVLASSRSAGSMVDFKGRSVTVQDLSEFDFSGWDFALFSAGGSVSAEHAPRAARAGCTVIDNTSHFRLDPDVPLVVPEVNAGVLDDFGTDGGIIANPNCSTIQMLLAVAPIHRAAGVARINVATYQSVSGAGHSAMEELAQQSKDRFNFKDPEVEALNAPIAFNVIPMIDKLQDNGYTKEEMKMHNETRRILDSDEIAVNATAVRVPVFFGHGEAVHLETVRPLEVDEARRLLSEAPGVKVVGDDEILTPLTHASGHDETFVSRIRRDLSHPQGLDFWVVADNVRKGAALNAIQIAEYLINRR
ncbi:MULTISPECIES: aspartate-semialdehyde dehydrogenase [unclassified Wenzhouxiangella]|uniref:aspartate-semialdehyde dehydrogenase n=1 Tax=unclassified Wenzhouxiangella TaxID=2613841 RepID=UPI000E3252ED|nr:MULTISPECIES: aspartate-semialdehyde dehydrogenase [unclassified Wenzhouxiangella]RFF27624.1 aspartate-semialdehyde dehydrogenase [Wenzhouxiangella sp. 15181]RFP70148.1 aspartate-semialdehyde dehydrogenase [Wenzhouxiangella sp. 15190]